VTILVSHARIRAHDYLRDPITDGGTTFHFVTDGIGASSSALTPPPERAMSVGGGVDTIRQYPRS
jgi:hypothetical protein